MPRGRPSTYTPEIAADICARLADGESLRAICSSDDMPPVPTVIGWCHQDPAFAERYARARQSGLDVIAESIIDISDNLAEDPNSRRVRVDSRKWLLSKLAPRKYGDRLELAGDKDAPLEMVVRRLDRKRE